MLNRRFMPASWRPGEEATPAHLGVMSRRLALQRSATRQGGKPRGHSRVLDAAEGFSGPAQRVEPAYRVGGENFHCPSPNYASLSTTTETMATDPTLLRGAALKAQAGKPDQARPPALAAARMSRHFCLLAWGRSQSQSIGVRASGSTPRSARIAPRRSPDGAGPHPDEARRTAWALASCELSPARQPVQTTAIFKLG
jgi:hypothetical protein